jgi:heat shock protein HspQ
VQSRTAKFKIGQIVRHRFFPFRGVIYDVDPVFANTEEWYQSIPAEMRPSKDQPFYHLYADNAQGSYEAYVSEQNLLPDAENGPIKHPMVREVFDKIIEGCYQAKAEAVQHLRH